VTLVLIIKIWYGYSIFFLPDLLVITSINAESFLICRSFESSDMVIFHPLFSFLTGILIGTFYGLVFNKSKPSSALIIILLSLGRYTFLIAITLLINMLFPVNLLIYTTGFFCAFWLFIYKRIGLT